MVSWYGRYDGAAYPGAVPAANSKPPPGNKELKETIMPIDRTRVEHESYGVITFSRATGHHVLFGSSIEHDHVVIVQVHTADYDRNLSQDWIHPGEILLEGVMSTSQFADAITPLNQGSGTPITLKYVKGDERRREAPPAPNKQKEFEAELSGALEKPLAMLDGLIAKAKTKTRKRELEILKGNLRSSLPFMREQFAQQMDQTVNEAKAEVEAFAAHREREAGRHLLSGEPTEPVDTNRSLPVPVLEDSP